MLPVAGSAPRAMVRCLFVLTLINTCLLVPSTASADTASAVSFIAGQQREDGAILGDSDIATAEQSTAQALTVLSTGSADSAAALAFLRAEPAEFQPTEYLARIVIATASNAPAALAELRLRQNADGSFGMLRGHPGSVLDTAFALQALAGIDASVSPQVQAALVYLISHQSGDGSWNGSLPLTAQALLALQSHESAASMTAAAQSAGSAWLLGMRDAGAWQGVEARALMLLALSGARHDASLIENDADLLAASQLDNGSWQDDVFLTALAVRALRAFDARRNAIDPTGNHGAVAGRVIRAATGVPVEGAQIRIAPTTGAIATTDSLGRFLVEGIAAGTHTLMASAPGYTPAAVAVSVLAGEVAHADDLVLAVDATTAILTATAQDNLNGSAVAGVQFALQGPVSATAVANADGNAVFPALLPGGYEMTASHDGYRSETIAFSLAGGESRSIRQMLLPADAYSGNEPVALALRVIDDESGEPVESALLAIGVHSASSGADGRIRIDGLLPGAHDALLTAAGRESASLSFSLPAGADSDFGDVVLHTLDGPQAPVTLDVLVTVSSSLDGSAIPGALLHVVETGQTLTTNEQGRVSINGLSATEIHLAVSANGFVSADATIVAEALGSHAAGIPLAPAGDPSRSSSTLSGIIRDGGSGQPIAGASVTLAGVAAEALTDAEGRYRLESVASLAFQVLVAADGYRPVELESEVAAHGDYSLDVALQPGAPASGLRVIALESAGESAGVVSGSARIANEGDAEQAVAVAAEVVDARGARLGSVQSVPGAHLVLLPGQSVDVPWHWSSGNVRAGDYRLAFRLSEPGSTSRNAPLGVVLAEASTRISLAARRAVVGQFQASPPVVQLGTTTPVSLNALIVNNGNVDLAGETFRLRLVDTITGEERFQAEQSVDALAVGEHRLLEFGAWLPDAPGDLQAFVEPLSQDISGNAEGELYVGNIASGELNVSPAMVLPGDQLVQASLLLEGIDAGQATGGGDPFFLALKEAVRKGAGYVAPASRHWQEVNRCTGCHVQTQSLFGLSNAARFVDVPESETRLMYNALASAQREGGEVWTTYNEWGFTQTALAGWAFSEVEADGEFFSTKYMAAQAIDHHAKRNADGHVWWISQYAGWWNSNPAMTYAATKTLVDVVRNADRPENRNVLRYGEQFGEGATGEFVWSDELELSPDGRYLYIVRLQRGSVDRMDLATGEIEPAPQISAPVNATAVLPAADGSLYVAGGRSGPIYKYAADGTRRVIREDWGKYYTDMAFAPGGGFYVVDRHAHRILHMQDDGSYTVVSAGGLFNQPNSLVVMEDGSLIVTNSMQNNLIKVHPDGTQEVFAEGLHHTPVRIKQYGEGFLYTTFVSSVHYVDMSGRVVRYPALDSFMGLAVNGDDAWFVNYWDNHVYRFMKRSIDDTELDRFRQDIQGALDWALAQNPYAWNAKTVDLATSLLLIAEALKTTEDPSRVAAGEQRIEELAALLAARQNDDGGWSKGAGLPSDTMVTALVGLSLEHAPQIHDAVERETLLYFLAAQREDGAWESDYFGTGIPTPPLASTSLALAYLPKALERLGGIDVDVHLAFAGNVLPGTPTVEADEVSDEGELTHYRWSLDGVNTQGREIAFSATMPAMQIGESRPLAQEAWLEFRNSFNDDVVRVDIAPPVVKAVSGMAITVATDSAEYGAHAALLVSGEVTNLRPTDEAGTVQLAVRAAGSPTVLAEVGVVPLDSVPANGSVSFSGNWNTGDVLPGAFEVVATLLDDAGEAIDTAVVSFEIARSASAVTAGVSTDKPAYGGFEQVRLATRVRNVTPNVPQRGMRGVLTVKDANGNSVHSRILDIPALAPNGHVDMADVLVLEDAAAGEYQVSLLVQDGISRATLASADAGFTVQRRSGDGMIVRTEVAHPWVYQGDANACTDTLTNRGAATVSGTFVSQLASLQDGAVISESASTLSVPPNGTELRARGVQTDGLAIGGYVCRLLADFGSGLAQVGAAGFGVVEPPIRIVPAMTAGARGRLLVLLDPSCADRDPPEEEGGACDAEPHDPSLVPLPVQRAHLEAVLEAAGWTYTIATGVEEFAAAFAAGGHELYALFSETQKLPEALQREIVADVAKGRGLLVAGSHDQRNGRLEDALGIRSLGKNLDVEGLVVQPFGSQAGMEIAFDVAHRPTSVRLAGAESLAVFDVVANGRKAQEPQPALTRHSHESGTGVHAGFDWLVQSAVLGDDGELGGLLTASLAVAHPQPYAPIAGRVFPLHLVLQNEGMATPGEVHLALPAGTTWIDGPNAAVTADGVAVWPFTLAEDQQQAFTVWLRMPAAGGPLVFEAVIHSGTGDALVEQARAQLVLDVQVEE